MELRVINKHPILEIPERIPVNFTFNEQPMKGFKGMMVASALIMNGINIFGHHKKDHSP
ncbi:MAG: 2Fe-2S iron-sulfur cluster-binding protein, partial [Promethearchaeota archaeon]